jgi:RND family efflux transporter MFP subunit
MRWTDSVGTWQARGVTVATAALLVGCSAPDATQAPAPTPQVRIAQVGGQDTGAAITGVGTIALRRETQLGFTSPGRIVRLAVNEGDIVRPGQMLAALDPTTVAADVAQVAAEQSRAAAEYRRSTTLLKQGWVTQPRVESARAALLAADARARAAGFQRANSTIVAPGPGVVLGRLAEPGQVVTAGTAVLVIGEQASGYVLRVALSDRDVAAIAVGAPATVTPSTGDRTPIVGRVVEIALPADARLRSGQIGEARIVARGAGAATLSVPPSAVFAPRAGEAFVYVVDRAARKVAVRKVGIAETSDAAVRVTSGLARGEWVATSRIDRLKDGAAVTIIEPAR